MSVMTGMSNCIHCHKLVSNGAGTCPHCGETAFMHKREIDMTQIITSIELKPCPFCGGEAVFEEVESRVTSSGKIMWSVGCNSSGDDDEPTCFGYQSPIVFNRKCEAAETWNTRSDLK